MKLAVKKKRLKNERKENRSKFFNKTWILHIKLLKERKRE